MSNEKKTDLTRRGFFGWLAALPVIAKAKAEVPEPIKLAPLPASQMTTCSTRSFTETVGKYKEHSNLMLERPPITLNRGGKHGKRRNRA